MNVYYIDMPSVSAGLKRTYCKKLEVFYGELSNLRENSYSSIKYYMHFQATARYNYNPKKGIWLEKPISKGFNCRINNDNIFDTAEINKPGMYSNLEAAQVAKLLMVQRLATEYTAALKELEDLFQRNVPDVTKPFDQLLETHPDLFI